MIDNLFPLYCIVFLVSFASTVLAIRRLIPALKKNAEQPIYDEGPKWHKKKQGTPTMGGLAFVIASCAAVVTLLPFMIKNTDNKISLSILISLGFAILNSFIGVIDDLTKLRHKKNKGLTPTQKLPFQFSLASLFLIVRKFILFDDTSISFAFGTVELGFFYYPISLLILVGIINFANLTDGIDGLAASVSFSVGVSMLFISSALFEDASVISALIIGISTGFLIFNINPAKIFMGDTGSLFLGAIIAAASYMLDNPFIAVIICGVYCLEGLSVIIQVAVYKITKKRVFKMAPFHHHLEACGWNETKICMAAILLSFIFAIPAYIFYLP